MERESTYSLYKKNMLFRINCDKWAHTTYRGSAWMTWIWKAPCLSVHVLFVKAIKLSKMWPLKKWNIVQSWRIPLSWGRIGRESGFMCVWLGLGLGGGEGSEVEERGTVMMDRHAGAPPVSKQQECRAGWWDLERSSNPLMWSDVWSGGVSQGLALHTAPEIQTRATGIQLGNRLEPTVNENTKMRERTRDRLKCLLPLAVWAGRSRIYWHHKICHGSDKNYS